MSNVLVEHAAKSEKLVACDIRLALTLTMSMESGLWTACRAKASERRQIDSGLWIIRPLRDAFHSFNSVNPVQNPPWWLQRQLLDTIYNQKVRANSNLLPFRLFYSLFSRRASRTCAITACAKPLSKTSRLMGDSSPTPYLS